MSCFPCFSSKTKRTNSRIEHAPPSKEPCPSPSPAHTPASAPAPAPAPSPVPAPTPPDNKKQNTELDQKNKENQVESENINAKTFTFRDLATATKNFRQERLLGEGGFGRVYKGTLQGSGQVVAVKQLDRNGMQGNKEFLVEVLVLSLLHHPNLVNLIGYCADGDQRLLVHEYIPGGSLEDHLFDIKSEKKALDWFTRMRIAFGAAQGLEYLHEKANPPVIYRDLKSSNILMDEEFNPKLSDYGLAKLGPGGDKMNITPRVVGTYGYCAPEYTRTGQLTLKSDVYSFGVVLLELLSGRRAMDTTRPTEEQNLVTWAQPLFRDPRRFPDLADPRLNKHFPESGLNQAVAIAAMCLQEEAAVRPLISDVVTTLGFLSTVPKEGFPAPPPPSEDRAHEDEDSSDCEDRDSSDNEDGESVIDQDEEGATETRRQSLNSSQKSSISSRDGSTISSSQKSSWRSQDASVSASSKSNRGSQKQSHKSSRKSHDKNASLRQKSGSKSRDESVSALSRKARTRSSDRSVSSSRCSNSRGSQNGSVSSGRHGSRGSQNGTVSISRNSSRISRDESVDSS